MTTRHTPGGALVSPRVAASMIGVRLADLDDLIRRGVIRTERIKGNLYIDLDAAERAVKATREGGA